MDSKKSVFARLKNSKDLPSLPQVLLKLIEICDREDAHLSELSDLIVKDVSISSRVLSLVNSTYFGLNNSFSNIDQAVVYLGADTIKNIALTASVQQVFSKLKKNKHLSMSQFWWNSFSSAIYAKRIARQISYTNIEEAYIAGLLHDLGELLLWINFSDECAMVPTLIADKEIHQCIAEEEQIGINHCEAGAWLIKQWNLNPLIGDAVLYHHSYLEQIKDGFPLVKLVYFADQCCQVGNGDFEVVYDVGEELFDLTVKQIDEVRKSVAEETKEIAKSLGIEVSHPSGRTKKQVPNSTGHEIDLLNQVRNYSLLHGFMENLVQAENRDAIFKAIEKALKILFDIDTIFFFLHDFEQQKLYGNASTLNPFAGQLQGLVIPVEQGTSLLVKSMLERESRICLQDTRATLENLADSQLLDIVGGKGMLYVPMLTKKKPVGVIVVGLPDSPDMDLSISLEVKLLQLLANQAAISLYMDILKRKQDEKIQAARLEAASMVAAKVVREVNSPLAIIRNYLKILELKVPENEPLIQSITIIDEEINRISEIIQQFDSLSCPVQHKFELTDINTILSDLLSILSRSVFYSSQLHLHFSPEPDLPQILTDESSIKQIVINLIKNATEVMAGGGNVYIETSSVRVDGSDLAVIDAVKITLFDDGPGMPDEVFPHLFEPFISTKGKGHSGLGLSIVKSLVTELKGSVECCNRHKSGTLFTIILPVK